MELTVCFVSTELREYDGSFKKAIVQYPINRYEYADIVRQLDVYRVSYVLAPCYIEDYLDFDEMDAWEIQELFDKLEDIEYKDELNHLLAYCEWSGDNVDRGLYHYEAYDFYEGSLEDFAHNELRDKENIYADMFEYIDYEQYVSDHYTYYESNYGVIFY